MLRKLDVYIGRHPIAFPFGVLAIVVFVVWGHCLSNEFVWDDNYYIVTNEALRTPAAWSAYFTDAETQKSMAPYPYRALRTLHFGILTWITGQPVSWLFHLANIVWHIAASYFLFVLVRQILSVEAERPASAALLAALFFSVHPVASEVVPWAKALDDIMSTTWVLAAFIAAWCAWAQPGRVRPAAAIGSIVFFALALWSKESVVALAVLFLFPVLVFRDMPRLKFGCWFGAVCVLTVVFLLIRHSVLQYVSQVAVPLSGSHGQTLLDMIPVTIMYLRCFLGLPPFHPDYSYMKGMYNLAALPVIVGAAIFLGAGLLWLYAFARRERMMPLLFGLSWIALALVPVSNVVPMMQYFAIRFAYLPLVGVAITLGFVISSLAGRWRLAPGLALIVTLVWAVTSFTVSAKWKSDAVLWEHAIEHTPISSRIVLNYATTLHGEGDRERLEAVLDEHSALLDAFPKGKWLKAVHVGEKDPAEGLRLLRGLEEEVGNDPQYLVYVGVYHARLGHREEAHAYFFRAAETWPSQADAWKNLGLSFNDRGQFDEAKDALARAVALDADDVGAWQGYSFAAWSSQDWPLAEKAFARLAELDPGNEDHLYWLQKAREAKAP